MTVNASVQLKHSVLVSWSVRTSVSGCGNVLYVRCCVFLLQRGV